jgi:hypothetical protein
VTTEWLWRVPSGDGTELAVTLRRVQGTLAELAHDLPAGRASPQRIRDLATLFRQLAAHLDAVSGISPADTDHQ